MSGNDDLTKCALHVVYRRTWGQKASFRKGDAREHAKIELSIHLSQVSHAKEARWAPNSKSLAKWNNFTS